MRRIPTPIVLLLVIAAEVPAMSCAHDAAPSSERTSSQRGGLQTFPVTSIQVDTANNQLGRLTTSGGGGLRAFYQYDARGRPTATQYGVEGTSAYTFTSTYGYPKGAAAPGAGTIVTAQTFPDGELVTHSFDEGGGEQAISADAGGTSIVNRVVRNARGQTVRTDTGDGTSSWHCYNDGMACNNASTPSTDMRLKQIVTSDVNSNVLQAYGYAFDAHGSITSVNDYCDAPSSPNDPVVSCCNPSQGMSCPPRALSAGYAYDPLDRLTSMSSDATGTYAYAYDDAGNLTQKEGQSQSYGNGAGPHGLTQAGAVAYSYDANGNVAATSDGTSIAYNGENMAVHIARGGTTIDKWFVGESVWKKVDGSTTTYYLPSFRVENGNLRKFYGSLAERDPDDGNAVKFYHSDHLGSSTLVTRNGAPIFRGAYYPYGEKADGSERIANASMPYSPTTSSPKYRFNFKEKDDVGFYDYGARMYNPTTGRFLSADSSIADGLNRYAYVEDSPLVYTDPTGHGADSAEDSSDQGIPTFRVDVWGKAPGISGFVNRGVFNTVEPLLACGMGSVGGCAAHVGITAATAGVGRTVGWMGGRALGWLRGGTARAAEEAAKGMSRREATVLAGNIRGTAVADLPEGKILALQGRYSFQLEELNAEGQVFVVPAELGGSPALQQMGELTAATGRSLALVSDGTGRTIVSDMGKAVFLDVHRIVALSHPDGRFILGGEQAARLAALGQRSVIIVDAVGQSSRIPLRYTIQNFVEALK